LWIQALVVGVSGGLYSPLLPILPPMTLQVALVFGRSVPLGLVLAGQLVALWVYAGLELSGFSLRIPALGASAHGDRWALITAAFLTVFLAVGATAGAKARGLVAGLVRSTIAAHDRERVLHAEQARELVTLSGEIAHELKNPLASIKGLSALLARDLTGKDAERLAVLRAEVDRMHETLDEFLDFSRPVVPLTLAPVDLAALSAEVVAVCEGVAAGRGVRLSTRGEGEVVADRRKLRQVLVNLLQNAIEAAPARSEVEVVVAASEVEVLDRGPGVAQDVREVVFEPGVTTRPRGSGLGLTIARALVAQHGGELGLEPRPGGGTRARVRLGAT
ncbi:MAG: HAMP domain-containing sensor histidine kinase, partial [Myxococcota bacterium]